MQDCLGYQVRGFKAACPTAARTQFHKHRHSRNGICDANDFA